MIQYCEFDSPFGPMLARAEQARLTGLWRRGQKYCPQPQEDWQPAPALPLFSILQTQLHDYATGLRRTFELPLSFSGSDFQCRVWQALLTIPPGETRSYSALAQSIGKPTAVRAVAAAVGRNPLLILVPCHRIVGRAGHLTGFAAGLDLKRRLLQLEQTPSRP
ncbi:methylated-DNA--[protein]-cysteine S-methyltransferase [Marinobacterium aestuariivivens]|uniref:Methylated-DNA--protein-cysteine methyltransferase n=1 Tax=Marinobacterium aestuariivivens TaxID=1698799 RepID=A0ABW2A287_9GAMM